MILADKIAQEIMGSEYFQSLFVICMERSYYQILNLCKSIQYIEICRFIISILFF